MSRCERCPVEDRSRRCFGEATGMCRLAHRDDYRDLIVRKTAEGAADLLPPRVTLPPRPVPVVAPQPPPPRPNQMVLRGHGNDTGYGRVARYLLIEMDSQGVSAAFDPIGGIDPNLDPFVRSRIVGPEYPNPMLQVSSPDKVERPGAALLSMWETTLLPPESVATYNAAKVVVVPCRWNVEVFRSSGVTTPIRVVPLGIHPGVYRPDATDESPTFEVLTVAAVSGGGHRKRVPALIRAFLEAFEGRDDVRLRLKVAAQDRLDVPDDPRIVVDRSHLDDRAMAAMYRRASVYATMTNAEGWGLPIHEAMACGLPIVGPIHTGIGHYMTTECGYAVEWRPEAASGMYYHDKGRWYPPLHESMVRQLRAAYDDPRRRRCKAEAAAKRAAEFTWERSARELLAVLREFDMIPPARPSPPAPTIPLGRSIDLMKRRRDCPHSRRAPGCACNDAVLCSRDGLKEKTRAECYRCLEATA